MRSHRSLILACGLLLFGSASQAAEPAIDKKTRLDRFGDPLPPGALVRLGTLRLRHPMAAYAVAFSPDGKILASGGRDNIVRLWDAASGKELHQLRGHQTWVQALAFSPNGKILASGTSHNDRLLLLWDTASGKRLRTLPGHPNGTFVLAFSPDGKKLASSGEDGEIVVRDTDTGKELLRIPVRPDRVASMAYAPDGRLLATAGARAVVRLWDASNGKEVRQFLGHEKGICRIAFSPDGKTLVSAGLDAAVRFWQTDTGKEIRCLKLDGIGNAASFAPDGRILATKDWNGPIVLWNMDNGKRLQQLPDSDRGNGLAFAPDGKTLAGGGMAIRLWNVATGRPCSAVPGSSGYIDSAGFAADGKSVLSVDNYGIFHIWDRLTGQEQGAIHNLKRVYPTRFFAPRARIFFAPRKDGGTMRPENVRAGKALLWVRESGAPYLGGIAPSREALAAKAADETIPVFDARTGRELRRIKTAPGTPKAVLSPDGKILAVKETGFALHLADPSSGKILHRCRVGAGPDFDMVFSPDGKLLAVSGIGTLDLWDVSRLQPLQKLSMPRGIPAINLSLAFAPGGRAVAAKAGMDGFALWDVHSGKLLGQLNSRAEHIRTFAFAPDGRTLALGSADHSLRLWDAYTGQEIRRFHGHQALVSSVSFAPDGRTVVSGGWDGAILIWDATGGIAAKDRDAKELARLWDDLAADDAVRADRAFRILASAGKQSLSLLRQRLLPDAPREKPQLDRLIAELDSDTFAVREKADRELQRLGPRAESALRSALEKKPSPEVRRRIRNLLRKLEEGAPMSGPLSLLKLRAIRVLEQIGTEEAREILVELRSGSKEPALAAEARAALDRMVRRK